MPRVVLEPSKVLRMPANFSQIALSPAFWRDLWKVCWHAQYFRGFPNRPRHFLQHPRMSSKFAARELQNRSPDAPGSPRDASSQKLKKVPRAVLGPSKVLRMPANFPQMALSPTFWHDLWKVCWHAQYFRGFGTTKFDFRKIEKNPKRATYRVFAKTEVEPRSRG